MCLPDVRSVGLKRVDADVEDAIASRTAEQTPLKFSHCLLPCPFEAVRSRLDLLPVVRAIHQRSRSFKTKPHSPFKIARRIQYEQPLAE